MLSKASVCVPGLVAATRHPASMLFIQMGATDCCSAAETFAWQTLSTAQRWSSLLLTLPALRVWISGCYQLLQCCRGFRMGNLVHCSPMDQSAGNSLYSRIWRNGCYQLLQCCRDFRVADIVQCTALERFAAIVPHTLQAWLYGCNQPSNGIMLQRLRHGRHHALLSNGAFCCQHALYCWFEPEEEPPLPQHSPMVCCYGPAARLPESEE